MKTSKDRTALAAVGRERMVRRHPMHGQSCEGDLQSKEMSRYRIFSPISRNSGLTRRRVRRSAVVSRWLTIWVLISLGRDGGE